MYNKVKEINQVEDYAFKTYGYILKNRNLYINNNALTKIIDSVYEFYISGEFIYFQKQNLENLFRWEINTQRIQQLEGKFSLKGAFFNGKLFVYILGRKDKEKVVYVINKNDFEITEVLTYTRFPQIELKKGVILKSKKQLTYKNLIKDKTFWTFEPPNKQEITKKLHLHDNILIVPTKGNRLYGIDAESGEQLWELEDPDMAPLGYTIYNQKLYDIGRRFFIRIDHKTGKVEYKKEIKPVFEEHNFSLTDFVMDENYLYFTDSSKCKIGIMDLTNFEIVWTYQIEKTPENWQIHEPVVHGNRLYVKDEIGTLHIFEKTEE